MKRIYQYLILLFASCLLIGMAGCMGGLVEDEEEMENRFIELRFDHPALEVTPATRAADAAPSPLPKGSTVRIAAYRREGDDPSGLPAVDFSTAEPAYQATYEVDEAGNLSLCAVDKDGKKTEGVSKEMTVLAGVYDFYAVSPARPLTPVSGIRKITDLPHQEDVMTSFVRDVTVSQASRQVTLRPFSRKCAQVVFEVVPTKNNIVPMSSLFGTQLELTNISSSGASLVIGENEAIAPTGGDETASGQLVTTEFVELAEDPFNPGQPNTLGLNRTTAVVLPKTGVPFQVAVTVSRNGVAVTLKATISQNIVFEEGKQYVFALEVENDRSLLRLSVLDWSPFPLTDDNVGGAPAGRPTEPGVTPGIPFGLVVAEWDNIPWTGGGTIGGKPIN